MTLMPHEKALREDEVEPDEPNQERVYSLYTELMGEYSRGTLRKALELLVEQLNLVNRRRNPRNQQDRTYQYKLDAQALEAALGAKVHRRTLEVHSCTSEGNESSLEGHQRTNITTEIHSDLNSDSYTLPEASVQKPVENSEPEQPISETPPAAPRPCQYSTGLEAKPTVEDKSSAAAESGFFQKFRIKPKQEQPPRAPTLALPTEDPPQWWQSMFNKSAQPPMQRSPAQRQLQQQLEKYREWLSDPVLQKEAMRWAMQRDDVEIVTDHLGNAIDLQAIGSVQP
jgi:hypothetical protein